jgi:hypothetical protein
MCGIYGAGFFGARLLAAFFFGTGFGFGGLGRKT